MKINVYDLEFDENGNYKVVVERIVETYNNITLDIQKYIKDSQKKGKLYYKLLNEVFRVDHKAEEHGYMIAFSNEGKVIGLFDCCHGTPKQCSWSPLQCFFRLRKVNAKYFIMVHNHPSMWGKEIEAVSKEDPEITDVFQTISKGFNMKLVDHIIIGRDGYNSMRASTNVFKNQ